MGKSIRSKIKKKHRARKRLLAKPADQVQKALMAVRVGALDPAEAPGAWHAHALQTDAAPAMCSCHGLDADRVRS